MLDPNELLYAYTKGYFPMAESTGDHQVYWYQPELRGILPLEDFHIPKNLKRLYQKQVFELDINRDFEQVIRACAERSETWISEEIIEAYIGLHKLGFAHSFECYKDDQLVGGLYGVAIRKAFFGESMFHRHSNASKIALIHLVEYLKAHDFELLDTQYINDHLLQFGAQEISHERYMELLDQAIS